MPAAAEGHQVARSAYGPSAVLTPANLVTLLRFLGAPVFIAMILLWGASWVTFAFGGLLAFSDGVDGWVARRQGTTSSGAFLDPLADKVIVLGALFALVANGTLWWVPVTIIAVREVAMSIYRWLMSRRGVSIPARSSAKVKTLLQDLAIGLCLAPPLADLYRAPLRSALGGDRADRCHRRAVLPRRPPGSGGPSGRFGRLRLSRWRGFRRLTQRGRHAHRDRRGRNRAAPRPDHRHQLALARRGAGRHRRGVALPPGGRRQPRPDRSRLAHRARPKRRGDRLRGARSHPGRHHPRGDRRGDERPTPPRRERRGRHASSVLVSGARDAGIEPSAGSTYPRARR